jgi:glycosyltransferase involved in cell wall biosynthesis
VSDRKFSILLFGTQMAIGGAQKLLLDQARWFHAQGHAVTAVFFYDKQGLQQLWQQGLGFPLLTLSVIDADGGLAAKAWALVSGLAKLWRVLRQGHFDVIETFTYDSNLLALPVAWLAGVRVRIATHHGAIEGFPRWIERLHAWLINAGVANALVSVSNKTLEQAVAAGVNPARNVVIHNGIPSMPLEKTHRTEVRQEMGLEREGLLILSVGRLVFQKGHEYLVQAMPQILAHYPGTKVVILGEGGLRPALEAQIANLNLGDRVTLLGNRNDIGRFLASADVFVLPSRWEGLPVALLEAMEAGLPAVATRVEGVDEVLEDRQQGLLVPPENANALSHALLQLMADGALRKKMGEAAKIRIQENYTTDIMCQKYLEVMQKLVGSETER